MRTITQTLYQFSELSESAKEQAISTLIDINTDYNWWESVYVDAENIGLKITGFDLDRGTIDGRLLEDGYNVASRIMADHGHECETLKDANSFLGAYSNAPKDEDEELDAEFVEDLEADFIRDLLEDYLIILRHEWEYLTSRESITKTIEANEYEFDENGNLQ